MNKYLIRFNKSRGQIGRGSQEHVWRVFENDKEILAKHVDIQVPTWSETDGNDWNIACNGYMSFDNDTATIYSKQDTPTLNQRTCDGCTKCCQGHLTGVAHGHNFQPGTPCFFVGKSGCSIYQDRPADPCKTFKCDWLKYDYLPMWMRPDLCNVIVTRRIENDEEWLYLTEAGHKMDSSVLSWIMLWAVNNKINIRYQVDGGWNWIKNK
jgi:hypothetical protein